VLNNVSMPTTSMTSLILLSPNDASVGTYSGRTVGRRLHLQARQPRTLRQADAQNVRGKEEDLKNVAAPIRLVLTGCENVILEMLKH